LASGWKLTKIKETADTGIHGDDRAAARLARLGRPVKLMIGGIRGWKDEGFALVDGTSPA